MPRSLKVVFCFSFLFGTCTEVCLAPQTPPEPSTAERGRLGEKYVQDRLPFWQRRLQLQDWNISILTVHTPDLRPQTLGNVHWDKEKKTAVIRVLNASDYRTPYRVATKDMEFTIVHELIHLELASLPRSEASRSDEEHAINNLADGLLRLQRAGAGPQE